MMSRVSQLVLKNHIALGVLLLCSACGASQSLAQGTQSVIKSFQGSVQYKISYSGTDAEEVIENEPPTAMDMFIRVPDFILHTRGGRFTKTLLYINDSNRVYSIDAKNKRAFRGEKYRVRRKPPMAVATGDSAKILGQWCYAYRYTIAKSKYSKANTTTLWVTSKYRVDVAQFRPNSRAQAYFLVQGIGGCIPLRIEVEEATLKVVTEAVTISARSFPPVEFTIPKGMKVTRQLDYRR
jgi:hypothetical protein